jgi:hypothetical protein
MLLRNYGHDVENTVEDLSRKFAGTYIEGSIDKAEPKVYQIIEIIPATGEFCHLSVLECIPPQEDKSKPKQRAERRIVTHRSFDLTRDFPTQVGAANHGSTVIHTTRLGQRQWRFGLCDATAQARIGGAQTQVPISSDMAYSIFNPQYVGDYRAALDLLQGDKGRKAVALSPYYWMYKTRTEVILVRNTTPLGAFTKHKFFINKPCTDFVQELWDDLQIKV